MAQHIFTLCLMLVVVLGVTYSRRIPVYTCTAEEEGVRREFDGCNECTCRGGQLVLCTAMDCTTLEEEAKLKSMSKIPNRKCEKDETLIIDCLNCSCINESWGCSIIDDCELNATEPVTGKECQDGEEWHRECNDCSCANGHWECTREACAD